jgi:hypothetical protein
MTWAWLLAWIWNLTLMVHYHTAVLPCSGGYGTHGLPLGVSELLGYICP